MKGSLWKIMFFRKRFASKHYYISIVFIISLLLLFPSKVVSQTSNGPSNNDDLANRGTYRFSPATSIIFVVIVVIFFVIGCFSVFARRCMESGSQRSGLLMINGDNRRSRRVMQGLESNVIETFPTFLYSDVKKVKRIGVLECAICLNEFKDEENLRLIPKCCHVFHPECIDTWLVSRSTCPVCRADLVPVPGETRMNNNCNLPSLGSEEDATSDPPWLGDGRGQVHEISDMIIELDSSSNKKKLLEGKYPRSHSTGHSLIKPRNDYERFTLRLPQDVQKKLMNNKPELRRAKSTIVFPRASSSKKGYRSSSVGPGLPIHNIYEQFNEEGRQDRWGFTMAPPFFTRSRSAQAPIAGGDNGNNITASGSSSKSVKSPFDWLFGGTSSKDDEAGERSFTRLTGNDKV
ncbi:hypothetical protein Leryth_017522 [Lithospermum erythrorhizon]|nr:hypothetical protein Leryth_017522 [Lithospermum erythrorhizon]